MDVLVIGANGRVGTAISEHLGDDDRYEFTYVDVEESPHHEVTIADMTDYGEIRPLFDGKDAVIHLGYVRSPRTNPGTFDIQWSSEFSDNLEGTCNAVAAAVDAGLDSIVYASSNHAVGMYEIENAPGIYYPGHGVTVDHTAPPRPDSLYGVVKVYGEALCRLAAEAHGLRSYSLRIGAVRWPEYDHPYGDAEQGVDEGEFERGSDEYDEQVARLRSMWQSRRDLAHMVDRCLQDESVEFDIFYGVSDNDPERMRFDIDHAREVIGYDPADSSQEWDAPPE